MRSHLRSSCSRISGLTIAALGVAGLVAPTPADAAEALLSRRNQSQVHTWDSADPGASVLLHSTQCNDADINLAQGSDHGWIAEHFDDYFARFVIGSNNGLDAQYDLGQNGLTHYSYPKHITVYNGEVVVMSRNDGTLWRYSTDGAELGSVKTAQNLGQGMATDGVDLFVSLWTGSVSQFVRYDSTFAVQETFSNPTGMGGNNNIFDMIYDASSGHFFGLVTTGEAGTGTQSSTVLEFEMGGAVIDSYAIPFAADGIGAYIEVVCGDGVMEGDEECDDGNDVDTDECTNACLAAACGDSIVQEGVEECDDGNDVDTDECTSACAAAACGDGFVQEGVEACDDGNDVDDDACSNACVPAGCGDGVVNGDEACDDGNDVDDDECTNMCMLPACGDGIVQAGEECDDPRDPSCVDCMGVDDTTGGETTDSGTTDGETTGGETTGGTTGGTSDSSTGTGGVDTTTTGGSAGTGSDATTGEDSATSTGTGGMIDSEDGCGCASTDSTGGGLFGLALLLGVGRRRRR